MGTKLIFGAAVIFVLFCLLGLRENEQKKQTFHVNYSVLDSIDLSDYKKDVKRGDFELFFDNNTFLIIDREENSLNIFDISTRKIVAKKAIQLDSFSSIYGVHFCTQDSIYLLIHNDKLNVEDLYLIDKNAVEKRKIDLTPLLPKDTCEYNLFAHHVTNIEVIGNYLCVLRGECGNKINIEYFNQKHNQNLIQLYEIDDSNERFYNAIGKYPNHYQYHFYYNEHVRLCTNHAEKKILISFPNSDSIVLYKLPTLQAETYYFGTQAYKMPASDFPIKKFNDYQYIKKYIVENSFYDKVFFQNNKYYRVVDFGIDYVNEDSTINLAIEKPWQLLISDSTFTNIKSVVFEKSKYKSYTIMPIGDKWLIQRADDANIFDVIKINQ
ncbi:MAG: hypothetical protein KA974_02480 [Saprospiraceae bacterium]|nr:hypothetical protein [Saprospiraceae bacterium]MBP7680044.1 hypothetical protein [Saprospiraceae bacterium]